MLKRHIEKKLNSLLSFMPVVLITGARQAGKTTLVEMLCKQNGYAFHSFDEDIVVSNALKDPAGWIHGLEKPSIIDEVQRAPEIFLPIKRSVDSNRKPGQFILTGSANPLLLPRLGDSLAGRMGILDLYPFSQGELRGKESSFIEQVFGEVTRKKESPKLPRKDLCDILLKGGFPTVQSLDHEERRNWISSYLQIMLTRDVRDISNVEGLRDFPMLFRLLATRTANLLNISDLSRSLSIVNVTVKRYLRLLEALYFVYLLPSWFNNHGKRLIKSPKLHLCDTAFLGHLLAMDKEKLIHDPSLMGPLLETFVFTELQKLKSWSTIDFNMFHFRSNLHEVDFILEGYDGSIVGIEVKSARTVRPDDLKGLNYLQSIAKKNFHKGIILYLGDEVISINKDIVAMPVQALWG